MQIGSEVRARHFQPLTAAPERKKDFLHQLLRRFTRTSRPRTHGDELIVVGVKERLERTPIASTEPLGNIALV
jgi:hypothetical protein